MGTTPAQAWQDENGVRTCPQCGATFDGTSIGATPQARILCAGCTWARVRSAGPKRKRGSH